jgi:hypothetical protein
MGSQKFSRLSELSTIPYPGGKSFGARRGSWHRGLPISNQRRRTTIFPLREPSRANRQRLPAAGAKLLILLICFNLIIKFICQIKAVIEDPKILKIVER